MGSSRAQASLELRFGALSSRLGAGDGISEEQIRSLREALCAPEMSASDLASVYACLGLCGERFQWQESELCMLEGRLMSLLRPSPAAKKGPGADLVNKREMSAISSSLLLLQGMSGESLAHLLLSADMRAALRECLEGHSSCLVRGRCAMTTSALLKKAWRASQNRPFLHRDEFEGGGEAQRAWQKVVEWMGDAITALVNVCLESDALASPCGFSAVAALLSTSPFCSTPHMRAARGALSGEEEGNEEEAMGPRSATPSLKNSWPLQGLEEIVLKVTLPKLDELIGRQRELGSCYSAIDACSSLLVAAIKLSTSSPGGADPLPCPLLMKKKAVLWDAEEEPEDEGRGVRHGLLYAVEWAHKDILGRSLSCILQEEAASAARSAYDLASLLPDEHFALKEELILEATCCVLRIVPQSEISGAYLHSLTSAVCSLPRIPNSHLKHCLAPMLKRIGYVSDARVRIRLLCDVSMRSLLQISPDCTANVMHAEEFCHLAQSVWFGPMLNAPSEFWSAAETTPAVLCEEAATALMICCRTLLSAACRSQNEPCSALFSDELEAVKIALHVMKAYGSAFLDYRFTSIVGCIALRAFISLLAFLLQLSHRLETPSMAWARKELSEQIQNLVIWKLEEWKLNTGFPPRSLTPRLHLMRVCSGFLGHLFDDESTREEIGRELIDILQSEVENIFPDLGYHRGMAALDCFLHLCMSCPSLTPDCHSIVSSIVARIEEYEGGPQAGRGPTRSALLLDRARQVSRLLQTLLSAAPDMRDAQSLKRRHSRRRSSRSLPGMELANLWWHEDVTSGGEGTNPSEADVSGWGLGEVTEAHASLIRKLFSAPIIPPLQADEDDLLGGAGEGLISPPGIIHERDAIIVMLGRISVIMESYCSAGGAPLSGNQSRGETPALLDEVEETVSLLCDQPSQLEPISGCSDPFYVLGRHSADRENALVYVHLRFYNATACTITQPLRLSVSLSSELCLAEETCSAKMFRGRLLPGDCICWDLCLMQSPFDGSSQTGNHFCLFVSMDIYGLEIESEMEEDGEALLLWGGDGLMGGGSTGRSHHPSQKSSFGGTSDIDVARAGVSSHVAALSCGCYTLSKFEFLIPAGPEVRSLSGFRSLFSRLPHCSFAPLRTSDWAAPLSSKGATAVLSAIQELDDLEDGVCRASSVSIPASMTQSADETLLLAAWAFVTPSGELLAAQLTCMKQVSSPLFSPAIWQGRLESRCSSKGELSSLLDSSEGKSEIVELLTRGVFEHDPKVSAFDSSSREVAGHRGLHNYRGGEEARLRAIPKWTELTATTSSLL